MDEITSRDDVSIERIINEAQLIRNREDKLGLEMDLDVAKRELQKLQNIEKER
ncbi:MAG: hypothetical protein IKF17_05545 [Clostridia bacterium]|nr:hypothetical protein [Clostridia bacterium]